MARTDDFVAKIMRIPVAYVAAAELAVEEVRSDLDIVERHALAVRLAEAYWTEDALVSREYAERAANRETERLELQRQSNAAYTQAVDREMAVLDRIALALERIAPPVTQENPPGE